MADKRTRADLPPATDPVDPAELLNTVISALGAPEEPTAVAAAYANAKNHAAEVQAYAKIAGRDWTYYVKTLAVTIGRHTEAADGSGSAQNGKPVPLDSPDAVHIDLGPAKVVSRRHAAIAYNVAVRCWELRVYGRNGARVDGAKVAAGPHAATPLHSGAIVDVGGTQMVFILPDTPPALAPAMVRACLARQPPSKRPRFDSPESSAFAHSRSNSGSHVGQGQMGQMSSGSMAYPGGMSSFQAGSALAGAAASLQTNLDSDLSREDARDIKPPYSYATMITQAILSNADGVMSLAEIYAWIAAHYAYYRVSKTGWQNSIRHNLSLNKAFEKVPRRPNEPGKGMKWQISDAYRADFLDKVRQGTLSKSRRGSSVSRTLQIHLATHHGLPEAKPYIEAAETGNGGNDNGSGNTGSGNGQGHVNGASGHASRGSIGHSHSHHGSYSGPSSGLSAGPSEPPSALNSGMNSALNSGHTSGLNSGLNSGINSGLNSGPPSAGALYNSNGYPQPYAGHPQSQPQPGIGQAGQHMAYSSGQTNPAHAPGHHQSLSQGQQLRQIQPAPQKRAELASPLRHYSRPKDEPLPQALQPAPLAPGINLMRAAENGRTTYANANASANASANANANTNANASASANASANANTNANAQGHTNTSHMAPSSEPGAPPSSAPSTAASELGLHFTSPKKIAPLEAFTPERGSRAAPAGKAASQSSPAFWNFVQFSTPNGHTPGRKNSDESNGSESPTRSRGPDRGDQGAAALYDSPPKEAS